MIGRMRKGRISVGKQDRLLEHFIAGTTARTAAGLVAVHRNSATFYFHRLGEIIAKELEAESEAVFGGDLRPKFPLFKRRVLGSNGCLLLWSLQAKLGHSPAWLWPRIQRGWLRLGSYGV